MATAALLPAGAVADTLLGDHANPFNSIDFLSPGYGFAQQITVSSGTWDITQVRVRLGNQSIYTQIDPIVQIRDSSGPGGGPGSAVIGSFSIDGSQVPAWTFGGVNTAIVSAPPDSGFQLSAGSYWAAVINADTGDALLACYTDANPLVQDGVGGSVLGASPIYQTYDAGQTFSPVYGGYALLVALDGNLVPEPGTCSVLAALAGLAGMRWRRAG
jgi:hypothetical protein